MGKTWGDEFVLRAVADHFNAEVHLLTSSERGFYILYAPETAEAPGSLVAKKKARIFLAYTYPVHYDGLVADAPKRTGPPELSTVDGACAAEKLLLSPSQVDVDLCLEAAA